MDQKTIEKLSEKILQLKNERKAVILAHFYQPPEVQDVADFIGDSLALSQRAANTDAEVIVFCGVHFMAESASILSPDKIVVLPDKNAGCPMADMIDVAQLRQKKQEIPEATVVCYVNTTASVKAECDIACTSANAVNVVASLPQEQPVLFVPDKNLGHYIISETGRDMVLWEGCCNIHDLLPIEDIRKAKEKHPEALLMVHPECRPEVVAEADKVASTAGMINFACESEADEFIVATEKGILHPLKKRCPDKHFYMASERLVCTDMKKITLDKVYQALLTLEPRVKVPMEIRERALGCLERMLEIV
ncbi:MAG: quinolinate synthase NadA [Peptococcaceae bacterium]|nr:quinolinate synthase NadA [Peptococcaceae bacterium]